MDANGSDASAAAADGAAGTDAPASVVRYLEHLRTQRRLSPHSLEAYRRELAVLRAFADADGGRPIDALVEADIRRHAARLHANGLSPRSIARALSAWRGYYDWRARHEDGAGNPVAGVRAPRLGRRLPKALPEHLAMRLLDTPATPAAGSANEDDDAALVARDQAIHELLYSSGLRLSELVGLDVAPAKQPRYESAGWLDLVEGEVTVTGKGAKRRMVPVGRKAADALRAWLLLRPGFVRDDPHPLFLSRRGLRLSGRAIQLRLKARAQAAGIPANVHPHVLRHSFASHLLQSTGDLRAVQELLGHASIAATQVYTSLDFQRLAAVYDAAHPRARRK